MSQPTTRRCTACGALNRIPARHLAATGRCGSCKATLPPVSEPLEVDGGMFADIVANARVPVLVDFWAPWCGPCRMAAPEIQALAQEMAGQAIVLKVNTDQFPDLGAQFRVQSIPNFVVLANGRTVLQRAGLAPRSEMRKWIEQATATLQPQV